MEFEWDEKKNEENVRRHGIAFLDAARVFYDPHAQTRPDRDSPIGEERFQTIGATLNGVLFVVHVNRSGERIRIVSARKARKSEKRSYRAGTFGD